VQWSKTARITGILSTQEVNLSVPKLLLNIDSKTLILKNSYPIAGLFPITLESALLESR